MESSGGSDRVTNKQLYDELKLLRGIIDYETDKLASKSEMRLTVALAVLGGNTVAALVLKYTSAAPVLHGAFGQLLGWL